MPDIIIIEQLIIQLSAKDCAFVEWNLDVYERNKIWYGLSLMLLKTV